jgi:hypothetical protein
MPMTVGKARPHSVRPQIAKRTLVAFATAPLIAAFLYVAISAFEGAFTHGAGEILIGALLMYVGALSLETLIALPSYVLLTRVHCVRWWSASGVGFVTGYIGAQVIRTPVAPVLRGNIPISLIGAASGLGFWLVVCRQLPTLPNDTGSDNGH